MQITKDQKALLQAVQQQQISRVREMLEEDFIDPNFPDYSDTTPLHEAVRKNNLPLVRLLVVAGANVNCRTDDGMTPLELAEAREVNQSIIKLLKQKSYGRSWGEDPVASRKKKNASKKKAAATKAFNLQMNGAGETTDNPDLVKIKEATAETLPDIFKPEKWVGQVDKMQQLWEEVPRRLKKEFDFAAALTEARQKTLKNQAFKKTVLRKDVPPPPAAPG
ncbi:MAG: ankyrin repeat domain-containing protein [Proteobacteria bacterium]|nr:ankyrin repeat domain-containing protein [Pseudomonadota bacterium]